MMRMIDADALCNLERTMPSGKKMEVNFIPVSVIKNAPTIDAVPVVRCKDCEEYIYPAGVCKYWNRPVRCDGYCNYGAKMDGGAEE